MQGVVYSIQSDYSCRRNSAIEASRFKFAEFTRKEKTFEKFLEWEKGLDEFCLKNKIFKRDFLEDLESISYRTDLYNEVKRKIQGK